MSAGELLQFKLLQKFPALHHGISTRHSEAVQTYDVTAEQVHGRQFAWVTARTPSPVPQVDALLTRTPGIRLRIGVSDCAPLLVYDPVSHSGGIVHAGFRGTAQDIIPAVVQQFQAKRLFVGIGPAIGPCCYDAIDIQMENYLQLIESGVSEDHIAVMRRCTKCHCHTFYSYRAGDHTNFGLYFELA